MKKYKCIKIRSGQDTEEVLNYYANKGWKLVCRSWVKWWFILEKNG